MITIQKDGIIKDTGNDANNTVKMQKGDPIEYVPFGDGWKKEMMKWRKDDLLEAFKEKCIQVNELSATLKQWKDKFGYAKSDYNEWLNNEYDKWEGALNNAHLSNFQWDPVIRRMMGLDDNHPDFAPLIKNLKVNWEKLAAIDSIGRGDILNLHPDVHSFNGICLRFIYYADKVLNALDKTVPIKIIEIGGGYGGFCAILHSIAKHRGIRIDQYEIIDLPAATRFQHRFLGVVKEFINTSMNIVTNNYITEDSIKSTFVVSFYALGEFTDEMKTKYIEKLISKIPHGFILWNPHSGSSDDKGALIKQFHPQAVIVPEAPLTSPNNLQITF